MITVHFPEPLFRLRKENGTEFIFDSLRKKWVTLTPEEWVRQNFVQHLVQHQQYPSSLIAVEKEIQLGELKKRFDILVYDKNHQPWMMVECKAADIELNEKVFDQILRYHLSMPVSFLIITNGHYTCGWEKAGVILQEINQLPVFL
jgi:hypothetical protein